MRARFSFDPALAPFLKSGLRGKLFERDCARAATLKNAIEALGVPHTEVGPVRVNGEPATLQRIVREGDYVEVEATKSGSPDSAKSGSDPDLRFVADAHLGGLARFLRMLGFDTLHRNAFDDEEIRQRCLYALINEGARTLEEGIALRPVDIDVVYVNGYGFPAFRGGPMFHADEIGLDRVYSAIRAFHERDARFGYWEPAPLIERLARKQERFADLSA